jgi:hypothetical protein
VEKGIYPIPVINKCVRQSLNTVNGERPTGDRRQATGDRRRATGDGRQATGDGRRCRSLAYLPSRRRCVNNETRQTALFAFRRSLDANQRAKIFSCIRPNSVVSMVEGEHKRYICTLDESSLQLAVDVISLI